LVQACWDNPNRQACDADVSYATQPPITGAAADGVARIDLDQKPRAPPLM